MILSKTATPAYTVIFRPSVQQFSAEGLYGKGTGRLLTEWGIATRVQLEGQDCRPLRMFGKGLLMEQDARKIRRFAVQLPCEFIDGENKNCGTILNLSAQGCAMTADLIPVVSSYLSLRIDVPDGATPIEIELAAVRWVSEQRCGVEFIRISSEMLTQLRSFILVLESPF